MTKLYLVRRGVENYLGPMTPAEFIKAYRRLEFGLQDEVAGSCQEWVALDDVGQLKTVYPELGQIVANELLGGWKISDHSQKKLSKKSSTPNPSSSQAPKRRRSKSLLPFLGFCFVAGLILSVALVRSGKLRIWDGSRSGVVDNVAELLEQGDQDGFMAAMREALPAVLPRASKSKRVYGEWLPYLRAYAYQGDGTIEGFNARLLRGAETYAAPNECSVNSWRIFWKQGESQWADFAAGKYFGAQPWTQILAWDPAWISRRKQIATWTEPRSYYEACLMMASKALTDYPSTDPSTLQLAGQFQARIGQLLQKLGRKDVESSSSVTQPALAALSCIDRAIGLAALSSCTIPAGINPDWTAYLQIYRKRAEAFITVKSKNILASDQVSHLQSLVTDLPLRDLLTGFSYQGEVSFFQAMTKAGGSLRDAAKMVQDEFPDVKFIE